MNFLVLLGAAAGPEIGAQLATTVVGFFLVVALLLYVLWKPVLALLDERREAVSSQFGEIDRKLAEANALAKDYEERLKRIDDEARERLNKAVDEGRKLAAELIEKARHDAEDITVKTRQSLALEVETARLALRREAVEMTLSATGKLLSVSMNDERQRSLVDGFISDLEKHGSS